VLRSPPGNWDLECSWREIARLFAHANRSNLSVHAPTERTPSNLDPELIEWLADHVVELQAQDRWNLLVLAVNSFSESDHPYHGCPPSPARFTVASADVHG
jgi:hypothetical protein